MLSWRLKDDLIEKSKKRRASINIPGVVTETSFLKAFHNKYFLCVFFPMSHFCILISSAIKHYLPSLGSVSRDVVVEFGLWPPVTDSAPTLVGTSIQAAFQISNWANRVLPICEIDKQESEAEKRQLKMYSNQWIWSQSVWKCQTRWSPLKSQRRKRKKSISPH